MRAWRCRSAWDLLERDEPSRARFVVGDTHLPPERSTLDRASAMSPFYLGRPAHPSRGQNRYPTAEADRGRHTGFARHEGLAGGPGSLSLSFAGFTRDELMAPIRLIRDKAD